MEKNLKKPWTQQSCHLPLHNSHSSSYHWRTGWTRVRIWWSCQNERKNLAMYYWPGMDAKFIAHIKAWCHIRKKNPVLSPTLLTPLSLPIQPIMKIHCDLYGPLRTSRNNKKYILTMTDAFTKYFELVAMPSKEASVVTEAIFKKWIWPVTIHTDGGKAFWNHLAHGL